jgi:hypothetical protein
MTVSTTMEGPSYTLETKCGWKGVLKSVISTNSLWNRDDHHGTETNSKLSKDLSSHTTSSSTASSISLHNSLNDREGSPATKYFPSINDISLYWMGGEPSKYDDNLEEQGVMTILKSLTDTEREEIIDFDMTVPIRHLRAEKVFSLVLYLQFLECAFYCSIFGNFGLCFSIG